MLVEAQLELLRAFDVPYRIRRLRSLVQVINGGYRNTDVDQRRAIDQCKARLASIAFGYEEALRNSQGVEGPLRSALDEIDPDCIDALIASQSSFLALYSDHLAAAYGILIERFTTLGAERNKEVAEAVGRLPDNVRSKALEEIAVFPFVDVLLFPLMDMSAVTDLIPIRTMRISPADCQNLSSDPKRLRSWKLGGFAGFLSRQHREHDLAWGRLDATDRLIGLTLAASGLPDDEQSLLRQRYFSNAVELILEDEGNRPNSTISSDGSPFQELRQVIEGITLC